MVRKHTAYYAFFQNRFLGGFTRILCVFSTQKIKILAFTSLDFPTDASADDTEFECGQNSRTLYVFSTAQNINKMTILCDFFTETPEFSNNALTVFEYGPNR